MQLIVDTYKNTGQLHHGYCIEGEVGGTFVRLCSFLESDFKFSIHGNPDFWHGDFDAFGIDDARGIKEIHASKPLGNDVRRVFVIKADSFTREAQNALLKILEEPGAGNHFFIITPRADFLLPTLRSRVQVVEENTDTKAGDEMKSISLAAQFLGKKLAERITYVKELLDSDERGRATSTALIDGIVALLHEKAKQEKYSDSAAKKLKDIAEIAGYARDRSSSLKMILEHIALIK
jgi:DNA polymerase III delta prime subunit